MSVGKIGPDKSGELHIYDDVLCIEKDEFCIKIADFCIKTNESGVNSALPYAASSFNKVVSVDAAYHFNTREIFAKEASR